MPAPPLDRRRFFRGTAAAAGAALSLTADSYARVPGANDRLGVVFLGCGGRAQAHIDLVRRHAADWNVAPAAVCDVWDGLEEEYDHTFGGRTVRRRFSQGLYPAAARCNLSGTAVTKDYRRALDSKDVQLVCVATPDHWHARMTLDAVAAGKDVFVEPPMTRTTAEAQAVVAAAAKAGRVVAVGHQQLADPTWRRAREWVQGGRIGPVAHLQGGAFRNDSRGYWRFYRTVPEMTARSVDWDLFLGHRFSVDGVPLGPTPTEKPFHREAFAQWRCDGDFSAGPFADLLGPVAARLLAATSLRTPTRVVGTGGLVQELDGRTVPDVATVAATFPGCHLVLTATTLSSYPIEEVIRGRQGAIRLTRRGAELYRDDPAKASNFQPRLEGPLVPAEVAAVELPRNETEAAWADFLGCVRRRDFAPLCPPDLGAAAVAVTAGGWESFRSSSEI